MTDQNQPPVPPSEPTPPANPDFTAPEAPALPPTVPPAPAYGAPEAPAAPVAPPAPGYAAPAAPPAPVYGAPAPGYGAPAYGAPVGYGQPGAAPKTNTFAIVSLVASVVGFFTGITFLVGIIFGHIAMSQIKKTGENGRGMAIAGLVVGYIGLLLGIIAVIAFVGVWAAVLVNSPYNY